MEGRCEGVSIGKIIARNSYASRPFGNELLSVIGNSLLDVGVLHMTGAGGYLGTPSTDCTLTIQDAYFHTSSRPVLPDLGVVKRRFFVDNTLFGVRRTYTRKVTLAASNGTPTLTLPSGYVCSLGLYVSTTTGITSVYLGDGAGHSSQVNNNPNLVAGSTIYSNQGRGFGSGYDHSTSTPKQLSYFTDDTLPAGATAVLEIEYFANPALSDPQIQYRY